MDLCATQRVTVGAIVAHTLTGPKQGARRPKCGRALLRTTSGSYALRRPDLRRLADHPDPDDRGRARSGRPRLLWSICGRDSRS